MLRVESIVISKLCASVHIQANILKSPYSKWKADESGEWQKQTNVENAKGYLDVTLGTEIKCQWFKHRTVQSQQSNDSSV